MSELMKTKELAKYLKLHEITITKYAKAGVIPGIRIGRVWRFRKEAIDKWISNLATADSSSGPNKLQAEHAKKDEE